MRMTKGWTGLRIAVIALGLSTSASTTIKADSILGYSTAGAIDATSATDGVTGANVISFVPISAAQIDTTSNIPLGYFQVAALTAGASTKYDNTPFSITFVPGTIDATTLSNPGTVTISGVLNGVVTGGNQSSVVATFRTPSSGSFDLGSTSSTLIIPQSSLLLVPSSAGNGETTVAGIITSVSHTVVPTPEPSTIALFLSTVGGLGFRKYVLGRRQRNQV
jgi:hypothetical protein